MRQEEHSNHDSRHHVDRRSRFQDDGSPRPERESHRDEKRSGPSRRSEYGRLSSEEEESSGPGYAGAGGAQRERRLRHLEMEVAELRKREEEPHNIVFNQPLSWEIMAIIPSERLRIPTIKPYGGTTDPADHLNIFASHMMVQMTPDAMWCRVFPATLEGHARA